MVVVVWVGGEREPIKLPWGVLWMRISALLKRTLWIEEGA